MATPRKKWSTTMGPLTERKDHPSEAAAYRYVREQAVRWHSGDLPRHEVAVHVDERLGRGWEPYETIDLRELPGVIS